MLGPLEAFVQRCLPDSRLPCSLFRPLSSLLEIPSERKAILSSPPPRMLYTRPPERPTTRRAWWTGYLCVAAVLWLMLWAAINTGPWVFRKTPETTVEWLHYLRAIFPLAVLLMAPLVGHSRIHGAGLPGPLKLWVIYGFVGLFASALSARPLDTMYWGAGYLAVLAALAAYLRGGDPLQRAVELNWLTWAATTGILAILCTVARHVLYSAAQNDLSTYSVMSAVGGSVGGMAMSRSTGMARFAAVPAIVAYVMLWRDVQPWRRMFWGVLFAAAGLLIYMMQSRGAAFSLAFALVAVTYVLGARARIFGIVAIVLGTMAIAVEIIPSETVDRVFAHITRGESVEDMKTMTGRTRDWATGWEYIVKSPVIGYGFQADRYLVRMHIHNTYLYVLITAGFLGLLPFLAGLVGVWVAAYRILRRDVAARFGQEAHFAQAVGILAFFTMRSIPEVSGAMFGVDLMVMAPAMAYLVVLHQSARKLPSSRAPSLP